MALIKCPECGKEISEKAISCIYCGFPVQKEGKSNTDIVLKSNEDATNYPGFYFWYKNNGMVLLECKKCQKVWKYKSEHFKQIIEGNYVVPNTKLVCPNCQNIAFSGEAILQKAGVSSNLPNSTKTESNTTQNKSSSGFGILIAILLLLSLFSCTVSGSGHNCLAPGCNNPARKSITGISGSKEWYCSTHYNQMGAIWDIFNEDVYG